MSDIGEQRDHVEVLAEDFLRRRRNGESPSIEEYTRGHPELADEIRELFPISMMLDEAATRSQPDYQVGDVVPEPPLDNPLSFGDYRILREIGRGGMGIVYEAEQISLHRRVALKILRRHLHGDALQQQRFEREAQAAARLHHHHIVPVFGVGSIDDQLYYVMQFIPGRGLDRVLEELRRLRDQGNPLHQRLATILQRWNYANDAEPPQPPEPPSSSAVLATPFASLLNAHLEPSELDETNEPTETLAQVHATPLGSPHQEAQSYWDSVARLGLQVASALEYAHAHNILHRDIKPSNLILDPWGSVWITDFGLAKTDDEQGLTRTGDVVGTLRYLAPEAFNGATDKRSDIYALGLTIFEILALRPAFDESDRQHLIAQITRGVPLLSRVNPQVPTDLVAVVHKATDLEPHRRYASAGELAADLQRFLNDEPVKARRVTSAEQFWRWARHNRSLAVSLAALSILLLSTVVGSMWAALYMREQSFTSRNAQATAEQQANESRVNLYYSHMQLARQAAETHRGAGRLHEILAYWHPSPELPDLRGWEWYFLNSLTHRQLSNWRTLHRPLALAWSPNGKELASADEDGQVRIWSGEGRVRLELGSHGEGAWAVAWSADQTRVASAGADHTIRIWNPRTGELIRVLHHDDRVLCLRWSPDGRWLISGDASGRVQVWSLPDARQQPAIATPMTHHHQGGVQAVAWRPGHQDQFASAGDDGAIFLWDRSQRMPVQRWQAHSQPIADLDWNSSGDRLASASWDRTVRIWNLERLDAPTQLDGHTHEVLCVRWSRDGQHVVSAGRDDTIRIWDSDSGQLQNIWRGHTEAIRSLAVHPQDSTVSSAGEDFTIRQWSVTGRSQLLALAEPDDVGRWPDCVAWSRDGRTAAFTRGADRIILWDLQRDQVWRQIKYLPSEAVCLDWSRREGRDQLAIGAADGSVHLWNETADLFLTIRLAEAPVLAVAWSPEGCYLAASDASGEVHLWDTQSGRHQALRQIARGETQTRALRWSPDGKWLAAGSSNGLLRLWTAEEFGPPIVVQTVHDGEVTCLAWSPDSGQLATSGADRLVKIWQRTGDAKELRQLRILRGHNDQLQSLDWSPDGRRLVTSSVDTTIRIWDPSNGKESLALREHAASVDSVRWNPNGLQLASASKDGSVRLWDATEGFRAAMSPLMLPALDSRLALADHDQSARRLRAEIHAASFSWDRAAADFDELAQQLDPSGVQLVFFPTVNWLTAPAAPGEAGIIAASRRFDATAPQQTVIPLPSDGLPILPGQFVRSDPTLARITTRVYCSREQTLAVSPMYADLISLQVNEQPVEVAVGVVGGREPTPVRLLQGWNILEAEVAIGQNAPVAPLRVSDDPGQIVRGLAVRHQWREAIAWLSAATRRMPENADLQRRLAETYVQYADALVLSEDARQQQQARIQQDRAVQVLEAELLRSPEDAHLAELLTEVILQRELGLIPAADATAESTHGTLLQQQGDRSWLATGHSPPLETYVVHAKLDAPLHGFVLEALADGRLLQRGPGRQGNFHLTGMHVFADQSEAPLGAALADHQRPLDDITTEADGAQAVLDGDHSTRWDVWPRLGADHWLAVTLQQPLAAGTAVRVALEFLDPRFTHQTLGRFRLYVSDAQRLSALCWWRWTAADRHSAWTRLAAARWLSSDPVGALAALREEDLTPEACWLRAWALMRTDRQSEAGQWLQRIPESHEPPHAGLAPLIEDVQQLRSAPPIDEGNARPTHDPQPLSFGAALGAH